MKIKSLIVGALVAIAMPAMASVHVTLHANGIIADSPEHLTQAIDLFEDGDEESFIQMVHSDEVIVLNKAIVVFSDDVNAFGGWVKVHI